MNLFLPSFYKSKLKTVLTMGLSLYLGITSVSAQMITTFAGIGQYGITNTGPIGPTTKFQSMDALEFDASGNLYICTSENKIFKITQGGIISLFAGNGGYAPTGDGGLATVASIGRVHKIAFDGSGNAYINAPGTHCIRKINTSGIITTIVGNGVGGFSGDGGLATAALTAFPSGLAVDATGNVYFSDGYTICNGCSGGIGSDYTRIRKIDAATGIITTFAGTGIGGNTGDGGLALNAQIYSYALAINGSDLFINGYTGVRKINLTTGIITNYAGNGVNGYSGDGGQALLAQFGSQIFDMKLDAAGNLYLTDWSSVSVIRKISNTGIVTTAAGTGTQGFSGDGGSPAYAKLNYPHAVAITSSGNEMYFSDEMNYRIRKVDFLATPICPNSLSVSKNRGANGMATITPVISPMLGTPLYMGSISGNSLTNPLTTINYSTSTFYTQAFPGNGIYNLTVNYDDTISGFHCVRSLADTILINNSLTGKSFNRRFNISNSYFCNTGSVNFVDSTSFNYSLNNPSATYTIVTNWGNGSIVTNTVNATNQILLTSASTSYTNPGVYTIQSIIKGAGMANDTAFKFVTVQVCGNVVGTVYNDINNDCMQSTFSGEFGIQNIPVFITSGTNSFMAWTNSGGAYAFNNVPAGTYSISVNGGVTGYTTTCPSSIPHLTTVTASLTAYNDFAMNCTGGFDVATTGISLWNGLFPGQTDMILPHVGILNGSCNFVVAGQVKMILTPCIQYIPGGTLSHVPDAIIPAITGDTLVWNVADINNIGNFGYWNYAVSVTTCTNAVVGDSACITMMVLPNSGDANPANNTFTHCFAIGVSYDPNYKEVSPKGDGTQGYIPATTNDLTYTLHFQNTGTAKATNIYLLDTLSTNLNLNTIEIISSSHSVQPYLLPGRAMKFMFAYINLPDSTSDEVHSHGYITYRIKPNTGLTPGTQIKNTGYIYFDYNSPIVTNTTLNTIEYITGINKLSLNDGFIVFPNPAKDKITVRLFDATTGSIIMYDVLGNAVKEMTTDQLQSDINTEDLTSGIYFMKITQQGKSITQKVVIQK